MKLHISNEELEFQKCDLQFECFNEKNVFEKKNNKTLNQTLNHQRYSKYSEVIKCNYYNYLDWPLGEFLSKLKSINDLNYLKFLNKYGDLSYCKFRLRDTSDHIGDLKGLYIYCLKNEVVYIGRCRDSFKKRINQGYGIIHPKNCFLDGQATNCHLNSLINSCYQDIELFVRSMNSDDVISKLEEELIKCYKPKWNIMLNNKIASPHT